MRAQAFNHATVSPGEPTAKPLHIRTARSSQGDFCLRIFRRWGPSGSRSPRYRGCSSNGWRRRRWELQKDFHLGSLEPGYLVRHLVLSAGKLLRALLKRSQTARHLLHLLGVNGGGGGRRDGFWRCLCNGCRCVFDDWWLRPAMLFKPTRDHLLGPRRPAKFWGPRRNYLLRCLSVGLPSQGDSDTKTDRDQVTTKCSRSPPFGLAF